MVDALKANQLKKQAEAEKEWVSESSVLALSLQNTSVNTSVNSYKNEKKSYWNRTTKMNLFASCYIWSMSGFVVYLVIYYSKYFKGNFYVNYSL